MTNDDILSRVKEYADAAHGQQLRKYTTDRYIVHPVRVMELLQQYTQDITLLCAALLHDVLEDTPVKKDDMHTFLCSIMNEAQADNIVKLVVELTDIYTHTNYPKWNRHKRKQMETERLAKTSAGAHTVKYADIIDNAIEITEKDKGFAKKFLEEAKTILVKCDKGNPQLKRLAMQTLQTCAAKL